MPTSPSDVYLNFVGIEITALDVKSRSLSTAPTGCLCITNSPLCRACMETDETPKHVMLQWWAGVVEQRADTSAQQQHFKKHSATWVAC
ncbi:jg27548 [Pararge aegeria aegeria]|uniref:Jg27548 protein n=1 Tax=Pararge aegeria aegeria TaxID=348720 RepID=A0A8S4SJL2_9NEOP|nr:jg27548 [Pararge aegeria aegeria]